MTNFLTPDVFFVTTISQFSATINRSLQKYNRSETMKTTNILAIASLSGILLLTSHQTTAVQMDEHIENALISVCKAARSNDVFDLKNAIKEYRLKEKTVAMKVVCNGSNIILFSEESNAFKTATHLSNKLGGSEIVDITVAYSVSY